MSHSVIRYGGQPPPRGDNLERQIVTMLTALVGLFVLMAIAWAVHDGQAALERQQDKHHND